MIDTKSRLVPLVGVVLPVVVAWLVLVAVVELDWRFAVPALALVALPTALVVWTTTPTMARRWALDRGVDFDATMVDRLRRHLVRTRLARTLGVTLGFSLNLLLVARYNAAGPEFRWFRDVWSREFSGLEFAGAGYVVGSVVVECSKRTGGSAPGRAAAVLARRRLRDFADRALMQWVVVSGAMVVGSVVVWNLAPIHDPPVPNRLKEGAVSVSAVVALVALIAAVAICRRAERAVDEAGVAFEELTRSGAVNALLGVSVAMLGSVTALLLGSPVVTQWLSGWILLPVSLVFGLWPLGVWYSSGTKMVFRSRRMDALRRRSARVSS